MDVRPLRLVALASLLAGLALLAAAAIAGDVQVGLFLIVPYVVSTSPLAGLGMLLVFLAGVLAFFAVAAAPFTMDAPPIAGAGDGVERAPPPQAERRTRHGGVVLLGPIPIVWGSDRKILPWMIGTGAALLALSLFVALAR